MKNAQLWPFIALVIGFIILPPVSHAENADRSINDAGEGGLGPSGLPLPRFASLRSSEVNLRTGPGTRYPIEWVYQRENMPLEITAEYDIWRRVRDWEGSEGWVHKSSLSGRRSFITTGKTRSLYKSDDLSAPVIAYLHPLVIGTIESCSAFWCEVSVSSYTGYLQKSEMWGVYPQETIK